MNTKAPDEKTLALLERARALTTKEELQDFLVEALASGIGPFQCTRQTYALEKRGSRNSKAETIGEYVTHGEAQLSALNTGKGHYRIHEYRTYKARVAEHAFRVEDKTKEVNHG